MVKAREKKSYQTAKLSKYFGVTRSVLYRRFSKGSGTGEAADENDLVLIKTLFYEKRERVGIRQLKMLLFRRYSKIMNRKKIARLKRENRLITKIRKKRNYIKFLKRKQEHKVAPNHLKREFKRERADEVYSTDITQLNYGNGRKAYLAVFKDLATKEVIAANLSHKIDIKLVNEALAKAIKRLPLHKRKKLMIHSDQGFHFTHFSYRQILEKNGITQSMSRKGNCIDNAPIESFFGYIKDHLDLTSYKTLSELKSSVTKEIDYYNYRRPQWDLKKMPPKQYRRHLSSLARSLF